LKVDDDPDKGAHVKLAEALVLRADAQKRLEQLKERVLRNAKVQEGDSPAEDPAALIKEYEAVAAEVVSLIQRINRTNAKAVLEGATMSDLLARRDVLRSRATLYRDVAAEATVTQRLVSRSEVKFKSAISVTQMQKRADALSGEHRELDARIQQADWLIELED
jgi:hypothetical protein